jgi:hypothetical protein
MHFSAWWQGLLAGLGAAHAVIKHTMLATLSLAIIIIMYFPFQCLLNNVVAIVWPVCNDVSQASLQSQAIK